jgi:hypothetical protein
MIDNLISARPELSAAEAKYCKLLAVSCLEHATEMSVETRDRVRKETRFLAQPNNMATARALGWIGPIALELLPNPEQLSDRRALLLAAAASAVRDEAAIDYLARLRTRRSLEIRNELAGAWQRFDTERYAREIIAHLDPEDLDFPITNRGELAALRRLGGRERIKVTNTDQLTPEELVDGLVARRVTRLYLMAYDAQRSLDWLHAFPQLSTLRLGPQVGAVHGVPDGIQVERDS